MSVTFVTNEDKAILDQSISQLSEEIQELKDNNSDESGGTATEPIVQSGTVVSFDAEPGMKITVESDTLENVTLIHQGKNFLPSGMENVPEKIESGVTIRANSDGSATFTGTCTTTVEYHLMHSAFGTNRVLPAGEYTVSASGEGEGKPMLYVYRNGVSGAIAEVGPHTSPQTFVLDSPSELRAVVYAWAGTYDLTVYCQIERGNEATEYEKFNVETEIVSLPHVANAHDGVNVLYTEGGDIITATCGFSKNQALIDEVFSQLMDTVTNEYDTVEDMLSDKKLMTGMKAKTRGYHSVSDGGAASYTVDVTNNGYGLVSANGYCNIVAERRMSPKMFGAVGDGDYITTDDSVSFQQCLDFCAGRYIVDITDGCYVIAGVKLYHGKTYDIVGGNRQKVPFVNELPSSIVVKYGSVAAFVGSNEMGADAETGLPLLTLNLNGVRVSGYYNDGFPTFVKDVRLTSSYINNVYASNMGCFIDGIMEGFSTVSNCVIFVSECAFRSNRTSVNGKRMDGFVDCAFYSNDFQGIMKFGDGILFKPVVFDTNGFYTIQFSSNFVGGLWAVVGCRDLRGIKEAWIHGWHSRDNVYSFLAEFATILDDSERIKVSDFKLFGDQIWNNSKVVLTESDEGKSLFSDKDGNTRIVGDKTTFFNLYQIIDGTFRDIIVKECDSLFPDVMALHRVTINNPIYMVNPYYRDFSGFENVYDTKFSLADYNVAKDTDYKYNRIEPWNNRVVDTLPIIQDENYRYVLEGQTCYYNNKLLTCRGDSWYDTMGNVVTE